MSIRFFYMTRYLVFGAVCRSMESNLDAVVLLLVCTVSAPAVLGVNQSSSFENGV